MNLFFPFFIAKRYLVARKSHNVINIVTIVSVVGIMVGSMALVIVLSVFNGFEKLILSLFNTFNPDIEVSLTEGKTFPLSSFPVEELQKIPGVVAYSEVLEETALLKYLDRQHIVKMRGVSASFRDISGMDTLMLEGEFLLEEGNLDFVLLGHGVAHILGVNLNDYSNSIDIYIPRRGRTVNLHPAQAFRASSHFASGIFGFQLSEFDLEYIIAPIRLARSLLDYKNEVSSIFIKLDPKSNHDQIRRNIENLIGGEYQVKDRFQQQEFFYKVMRSERWIIFLILTFIMVIAAFNIIGSITMLVMEKRKDIQVLRSMGASQQLIRRIFLIQGMIISLGGAVFGIMAGGLISWLQSTFGLITIQAEGTYIIDVYPVLMKTGDFVMVAITVFCIGLLASWISVRNAGFTAEGSPGEIS